MRAPDPVLSAASGRWLTLSLFAMETVGTVIYYWQGLPLYRLVAADPNVYRTPDETRAWSLLAIALIQVGYWVRYRIGSPQPQVVSTALGHIVLFLSRMVFTLATAVFSFVFISRKLAFEMPVLRYVLMLAGLFSLFLYMKDLQRLGNALIRRQNKPDESVGSEPVSARVA
jgi:hypothetical protein